MSTKEKNLPTAAQAGVGSVRTLGADGASEKTAFEDFRAAISHNDYSNVDKAKLDGIETGAQVNPGNATPWAAGLMSNVDKAKLDGIEEGATRTVVDSALSDSSTNPVQNKIVDAGLKEKADADGYYPDLYAGGLVTDKGAEDSVPYNFRPSGDGKLLTGGKSDREIDKIVGGSLVWNQLVQNGNFVDTSNWTYDSSVTLSVNNNVATVITSSTSGIQTLCSGKKDHKYFVSMFTKTSNNTSIRCILGSSSNGYVQSTSGDTSLQDVSGIISPSNNFNGIEIFPTTVSGAVTFEVSKVQFIDLTAMFGSTIADYIYSLEQANEGAGVAWFKKLFPKPYYEYAPVGIESVKAGSHVTVGFNQWDEEWELGTIDLANGSNVADNTRIRSKNYIPILPSTSYYLNPGSANDGRTIFYDKNKNFIEYYGYAFTTGKLFTSPANAYYMKISPSASYGTTYNHDICINLHWDGERDGEYEPYVKHSYSLGRDELRGRFYLDENNKLRCDGDIKTSDGQIQRRYWIVDLGTLDWSIANGAFSAQIADKANGIGNLVCMYPNYTTTVPLADMPDKMIKGTPDGNIIYIKDSAYASASDFKTAMSGVYLVYELATPTTETADPYTNPQIVYDWGTEEYTDYAYEAGDRDVAIPVGHETKYPENLREKIEGLPWDLSMIAPIENGATASKAYSAGQYFLKDDLFCKALTSIASGATFTLNTNYAVTTVAAELYAAINA